MRDSTEAMTSKVMESSGLVAAGAAGAMPAAGEAFNLADWIVAHGTLFSLAVAFLILGSNWIFFLRNDYWRRKEYERRHPAPPVNSQNEDEAA